MKVLMRLVPEISERIGSRGEFQAEGETIKQCLDHSVALFPELGKIIWTKNDQLNPMIYLFHNEDKLLSNELERPVKNKDMIDIIPAIQGG